MIDPKHEIINTILANMHSDVRLSALSNLYAENFTFQSPLRNSVCFDEHCKYLSKISSYGELEFVGITNQNNHYIYEILMIIIDPKIRTNQKFAAKIEFFFVLDLIEKLVLTYESNPILIDYIKANFSTKS